MALNTNTSTSIKRTSVMLGYECEKTKKNITKLLTNAGVKDAAKVEMVKTMLPLIPGSEDDVEFVGLNGISFYFKRGEAIDLPKPIFEILHNAGKI